MTTLFSGGFTDTQGAVQWSHRIEFFGGTQDTIFAIDGGVVDPNLPEKKHAEAQRIGVLGTDFIYSAQVTVQADVDAHLQFRISDAGRYGIRLRTDSLTFYRFRRENRPCSAANPFIVAHCPDWSLPIDDPQWLEIRSDRRLALASGSRHTLEVRANGPNFDVLLDGRLMLGRPVEDDSFAVGRFGIYVWGEAASLSRVVFADVRATTDPTHLSNFALLYSTAGYETRGTKRALVRTLNDLPSQLFEPGRSRFTLRRDGVIVRSGPLLALPTPSGNPSDIAKTFGMQLWEADFSSVTAEGSYTLHVDFGTSGPMHRLQSDPFEIRSKLVTSRMLRPLSILNAEARRAADEDFWRNWIRESGVWSVAVDGAFLADRADAQEGALLRRVFNRNNAPLNSKDFRYVGRITIVSGCDAQMQFRITPTERCAVTLQAGDGGGCPFGTGPGAVRLHCEGPDWFETVAAKLFPLNGYPNQPFRAGHPYDVEIVATGDRVTVLVDGIPQLIDIPVPVRLVPVREGGFGLKAWASTVRFERVQVWERDAELALSPEGIRIPKFQNKPCWEAVPTTPNEDFESRCNPQCSQLDGFHDCNNIIGEATSHGAFLAGLMEVWTRRAHIFSQADREALRRAIITTTLYLGELFQQRNASGEFAHSEMGRVAIYDNLGRHQSLLALYGESAFADKGKIIDRTLARRACERSIKGARWLWSTGAIEDPVAQSVIYARIARCAEREQLSIRDAITGRTYWELAFEAVEMVLSKFAAPGGMASEFRDSARVIPWFEGVYEVLQSFPDKQGSYMPQLNTIADTLVTHLTREHRCDDTEIGPRCAANGFFVLPQASSIDVATDFDLPRKNWEQMDQVPLVNRPSNLPFLNFYEGNHFAVATSDAVYVGRMTEYADLRAGLERIASGNFYWVLGLHPGIPASKVARRDSGGTPLQAASFVYNGDAAFARTMEGHRTEPSSAKGWVAPWEVSAASPHRETWWIDPQNRSVSPENRAFQSIVNGHVIWDQQWDYWNTGIFGWSSGETFLRNDGTFLKAAMLFEDWLSQTTLSLSNPYDTTQVEFFDTAHIDRSGTGWGFDDPNRTNAAQASRAANEFCVGKGYNGGRFTGHHIGERLGVLCVPTTARFFDATDEEVRATGWDFDDINGANWAQVARAATGFCDTRGYTGGFFTGHQLNDRRGIVCLGSDAARWFDATEQDLSDSGEGFGDINAVPWAKAARAATNICLRKGFLGGFFTGHQVPGKKGVVCFAR